MQNTLIELEKIWSNKGHSSGQSLTAEMIEETIEFLKSYRPYNVCIYCNEGHMFFESISHKDDCKYILALKEFLNV